MSIVSSVFIRTYIKQRFLFLDLFVLILFSQIASICNRSRDATRWDTASAKKQILQKTVYYKTVGFVSQATQLCCSVCFILTESYFWLRDLKSNYYIAIKLKLRFTCFSLFLWYSGFRVQFKWWRWFEHKACLGRFVYRHFSQIHRFT